MCNISSVLWHREPGQLAILSAKLYPNTSLVLLITTALVACYKDAELKSMAFQDPYFKKIIPFDQAGAHLEFRVSQELFSSFDIDLGTRLLLRTLISRGDLNFGSILDLGCGYGPIGLTLKKLNSNADLHMVDRDALAVEYSRANAELNGIPEVCAYGSLGFDDLCGGPFNLIVSNIPAKVGDTAITHFLRDARWYLSSNGMVAVVVVARLTSLVETVLRPDQGIEVLHRRSREGHTVFHYRFTEPIASPPDEPMQSGLDQGVYGRAEASFSVGDLQYSMLTAYNLAEFDSLSHSTRMLIEGIRAYTDLATQSVGVFNPGQGHIAVVLWRTFRPSVIEVVDRDFLALRYTKLNLGLNGCPENSISLHHQTGIVSADTSPPGLVVGVLREDEGPKVHEEAVFVAARHLASDGLIMLAGTSSSVSRLVARVRSLGVASVVERKKRGGYSFLVLRSKAPFKDITPVAPH